MTDSLFHQIKTACFNFLRTMTNLGFNFFPEKLKKGKRERKKEVEREIEVDVHSLIDRGRERQKEGEREIEVDIHI